MYLNDIVSPPVSCQMSSRRSAADAARSMRSAIRRSRRATGCFGSTEVIGAMCGKSHAAAGISDHGARDSEFRALHRAERQKGMMTRTVLASATCRVQEGNILVAVAAGVAQSPAAACPPAVTQDDPGVAWLTPRTR